MGVGLCEGAGVGTSVFKGAVTSGGTTGVAVSEGGGVVGTIMGDASRELAGGAGATVGGSMCTATIGGTCAGEGVAEPDVALSRGPQANKRTISAIAVKITWTCFLNNIILSAFRAGSRR